MTTAPTLYEYYTGGGINAGLSVDQSYFTLNDKNITIFSGTMHYYRIPKQYWRDRLRKLRATGANTVETYVPWNLHEPENGQYDFGQGGSDFQDFLDLGEYLNIAQEEDLFAIVRPGPYICAEWEWGGLPSWLLRSAGLRTRTSEPNYMSFVRRYFSVLLPILAAFQFMNGGPVIAFQVENEYGSSPTQDLVYIEELYNLYRDQGIQELLLTSDGAWAGTSGTIPELLFMTVNFGSDPTANLDMLKSNQPDKPLMVMEYWTGWFDHWSEEHHTVTNESFYNIYSGILNYPASANMYMFHGGTNWGFLNGANSAGGEGNSGFQPTTTSYDYNAPLSEAGDYTDKYEIVMQLIEQQTTIELWRPDPPPPTMKAVYPSIIINEIISYLNIVDQLPNSAVSSDVLPMEWLPVPQSYGYVIYRKEGLNIAASSILSIPGYVYDSVMVLVNGQLVSPELSSSDDLNGFGYWRVKDSSVMLTLTDLVGATLDIVVENMGRVNFGYIDGQFKGLLINPLLNGETLTDWQIYSMDFPKTWNQNLVGWTVVDIAPQGPSLRRAILNIETPMDTFIDMQNWHKGIVIVNGFVLGRYAMIGPQQTLYLPAPLLKVGENEIIIFEQFTAGAEVTFSARPIFFTR